MKNTLLFKLLIVLVILVSCDSENNDSTNSSSLTVDTTELNYNSATVSWNSITGNSEVFYNVYLNESLVAELISDLSYSFINLSENTNYTGKIEAIEDSVIIESSNFIFTTLENNSNEVLPSNFVTSVKHLGHVSTTIKWTSSSTSNNSPITYSVFVGNQMISSNLTDLELYIPNLEANTTYSGYVRAYNGDLFTDSNFSFTTVVSNIYDGRVILRTQQEVDDFVSNHYTEITDWLIIGTEDIMSDITDLGGLQTLVTVTGSLFVSHNFDLETTHGLQNISNDLNAIAIVDNTLLYDLSGFSSINKLLSYINIVDNPEITTLDAFSNMTNGINNVNVEITNNDKLVDIDGLSQLDLFSVYIRENEILSNIDLINSSDSNTLGQLYILNNPSLNDFSPLSNITLIKGSLTIGYSNLTNLDDLNNLNRTFGDVNIWHNSTLTDLCGLQNIVQNDNIDGEYNVHNNAYNPTLQNINDGNCSN
ncbi:hypothetical protein MBM09_09315 [Flaviramulus sp. BrNp1-15]|uniref:hypothetical protein n=1 Tax=Flaviramulus sp. BrNp1-15 TaxID=2916754 RepID=UPI001EE8578E|nr:hypothetical protein [Flaviramulus sp. BrNp1-15]ULC58118.1 hypothetical protein MBM09_09315 [Flaviramulus sp. BrNp1-15]